MAAKEKTKKKKSSGTLRITQVKSRIGRPEKHRRTLEALGLRKHQRTVEQPDNPAIRGMIEQVSHLVSVEETE